MMIEPSGKTREDIEKQTGENCAVCRYYREFDDPEHDPPEEDEEEEEEELITGFCRRYPPKLLSGCSCLQSAFPEVSNRWWCGEYVPQP